MKVQIIIFEYKTNKKLTNICLKSPGTLITIISHTLSIYHNMLKTMSCVQQHKILQYIR